jgi:hypothetical protein
LSLVGVEILEFTLDLVDRANLLQGALGNLALVCHVQVKELAPGVRQAAHLGDATSDRLLVSGVVVADQTALPIPQEGSGVFAGARLAEVVHHGLGIFECPRRVGPQVGPVRLAVARPEHLHRRLIRMQHAVLEDQGPQGVHQRLQLHAAATHPLRQGRSGDGQASAPKDRFLAIQGQVVGILGDQHLSQ